MGRTKKSGTFNFLFNFGGSKKEPCITTLTLAYEITRMQLTLLRIAS